ncbi:MAG: TolC family protein [Gemmatimonadales bacterium]
MSSRVVGGILALLVVAGAHGAAAQAGPSLPRQLSLGEALSLAKANSPTYRQTLNDEGPAAAAVRAAYGALFPTLSGSTGISYSRAGRQTFANQVFSQGSNTVASNYNLSASWSLSARELMAPGQQKAQQRVVEENITGAGNTLTADVTTQYLAVLRATASVEVARQQLARNEDFLTLARARQQVGQTNIIDVRTAEVNRGRSQVALLRAQQSETDAKIELIRRLGMPTQTDVDSIRLTETFQLVEPTYQLGTLLAAAGVDNPSIRAAEAQHESARIGVRSAKAAYLPSFSISTGLSGFTQQYTDINPQLAGALASAQGTKAELRVPERHPLAADLAAPVAERRHHRRLQQLLGARRHGRGAAGRHRAEHPRPQQRLALLVHAPAVVDLGRAVAPPVGRLLARAGDVAGQGAGR